MRNGTVNGSDYRAPSHVRSGATRSCRRIGSLSIDELTRIFEPSVIDIVVAAGEID